MRLLLPFLAVCTVSALAGPSYYRDVRPILQKQCQGCHQPSMKSSGLDLTSFTTFKAGGSRGTPVNSADPDNSLLIKYLTGASKPPMPLGQPQLPKESIDLIREWIRAGAVDDSPVEPQGPKHETVYLQPPVITSLRFSPDGESLAVSGNGEILLHRADGNGLLRRLPGDSERILSMVFSKDGSLLVAGGGTPAQFGELQFWDPKSGKLLRSARVTNDTLFGASLAPDASRAAVGCADNTVHVFDVTNGKELYKIGVHENWVLGTVFGIDSKRLVSVGRDRAAKLIDAATGTFLENVNLLRGELTAVARHPRQDIIVAGGEERIPYIYAMDRSKNMKIADDSTLIRKLDRQNGPIIAMDWSPDGKYIAVAGAAPEVNIYDWESGAAVSKLTGHTAGIYAVAFSQDGSHVATGGFDGQVRIYEVKDGKILKAFTPVPIQTPVTRAGVNP